LFHSFIYFVFLTHDKVAFEQNSAKAHRRITR